MQDINLFQIETQGFFQHLLVDLKDLLSAAKVWWPELSQLSLCSAFDKENSIESSLDSVHYLYKQSNPNPVLLSRASLWVNLLSHIRYYKLKKKKKKRNIK